MKKDKASLIALLTAPLVSAFIGLMGTDISNGFKLLTFIKFLLLFYVIALFVTVLFGLPLFVLFRRYNIINWWSMLGAGLAVGALISLVIMYPNPIQIKGVIAMSSMGGASAFFFWLIWRLGLE